MKLAAILWLLSAAANAQGLAIYGFNVASLYNACALSASTHQCFGSFITHRPLIVGGVRVRLGTVAAGDTLRLSLQTMSGPHPSGTMLASCTVPVSAANANSFVGCVFTEPAHLERAVRVAVVADFSAYTSGNFDVTIGGRANAIGYFNVFAGLVNSGRFSGSAWSRNSETNSLGLILLNELGVPIQMYWVPLNTIAATTSASNTTHAAACVSRVPIRIEGLFISRSANANYSPNVTISISKAGVIVWQSQWTDGRSANISSTVVPVSPPVVVGAGEKFIIRESGTGFVLGYRISNSQPLGLVLRETTSSLLACRPESGTDVLAAWPVITPLPLRPSMEVEW